MVWFFLRIIAFQVSLVLIVHLGRGRNSFLQGMRAEVIISMKRADDMHLCTSLLNLSTIRTVNSSECIQLHMELETAR